MCYGWRRCFPGLLGLIEVVVVVLFCLTLFEDCLKRIVPESLFCFAFLICFVFVAGF